MYNALGYARKLLTENPEIDCIIGLVSGTEILVNNIELMDQNSNVVCIHGELAVVGGVGVRANHENNKYTISINHISYIKTPLPTLDVSDEGE